MAKEKVKTSFSEDELKKFLALKSVVVVTSSLATSRTIRKLMLQLGTKADITFAFDNFLEAKKQMEASPIHILISDLNINENTGLDLISIQESKFSNRLEIASVIVCSNPSDATVGMIAESNIDGVLIAPFNFDGIRSVMLQALSEKVKPSTYYKTLETAKTHFFKNELELAKPIFDFSKSLDETPILSYYYMGLIEEIEKNIEQAVQCFVQGLELDPKDYRCLTGLFNLRMKNAEYSVAYELATRLHAIYPVSVNRILDLVMLSVFNKKFTDVLDYYEIFKTVKKREPNLNRTVIAGMLVCAKYLFLKNDLSKCSQVLKDTVKISNESDTLKGEVFRYLIELNFLDEASSFYAQLSDEIKVLRNIQIQFLKLTFVSEQYSNVIPLGTIMIKEGIKTIEVFNYMIESSKKLNRTAEKIDELVSEAKALFPNNF